MAFFSRRVSSSSFCFKYRTRFFSVYDSSSHLASLLIVLTSYLNYFVKKIQVCCDYPSTGFPVRGAIMTHREELCENYEDALMALLMDMVVEEEGKQLLQELEQMKSDPRYAVPKEIDDHVYALINEWSGKDSTQSEKTDMAIL